MRLEYLYEKPSLKERLDNFAEDHFGLTVIVLILAALILMFGIGFLWAYFDCRNLASLNNWPWRFDLGSCYVRIGDYWLQSSQVGYYLGR